MRLDELFAFPAERTQFSDDFYGALGRAIAFCTLFEANCRTLAILLGLKAQTRDEPLTRERLDDLLDTLTKRRLAHHIDAIFARLGLSREVRSLCQDAREARNRIAHDFALGSEREAEDAGGHDRALAELGDLVTQVATADVVICALGQLLTDEQLPDAPFVRSYPTRIRAWVCDVAE